MPILLDNVAQKYPKLKIIIEHVVSWGTNIFNFDQSLAVLTNNKNTYAGITGDIRGSFRKLRDNSALSQIYDPRLRLLEQIGLCMV